MMKQCLICQKQLKWVKFKCLDGHVCKACYEIVSISFSQTITQKTKVELMDIYKSRITNQASKEFEVTRSINQFVLFDDIHRRFCLTNHSKYTRTSLEAEYYTFSELVDCQLNLDQYAKCIGKKEKMLGTIEVRLMFKGNSIRSIWLVPNPIRIDSISYKTMESLANKTIEELNNIKCNVEYAN